MPPRTKNATPHDVDDPPEVITSRYDCPFTLRSEYEARVFVKLNEHEVSRPRFIEWELINDLRIKKKVVQYLKVLGLDTFAQIEEQSAYVNLNYEFLCTLQNEKKKIHVRMKNKKYTITLARMKAAFGFHSSGIEEKPANYNPHPDWKALCGYDNWDASGMSNGYLVDPALLIVHKFIAYNISGKKEANKVNATECFLLTCALKGDKVAIAHFIWHNMHQTQTRPGTHASYGAIITGLAHLNGVISKKVGWVEGDEEVASCMIDYQELHRSNVISDRYTFVPPAKRQCVLNYCNKERLKGRMPPIVPEVEAGPSNVGGQEGEGDDMEEEEDEEEEAEPQHDATMSGDDYQRFHSDFESLRAHFDTSFGTFSQGVNLQFAGIRQDVNSRFDAHNQQFATFSQDVYNRFDAQNREIQALQQQWDAWTAFYPPPPPPSNPNP